MLSDKEYVLDALRRAGLAVAQSVQEQSASMSGTEINESRDFIPDFKAAKANKNMLERKSGEKDGFVCRSSAGRVVRLIQPYDSEIYTQEPEELEAQWRFVWSKNPLHPLPFVSLTTSPYTTGDCCTYPIDPDAEEPEIHVWQSGQDTNTWAPGTINIKWTDLGTVEEVRGGA